MINKLFDACLIFLIVTSSLNRFRGIKKTPGFLKQFKRIYGVAENQKE